MSVSIAPMEDSDFLRGFEILSEAFGLEQEYINVVFPNHMTPKGREVGAQRLLDMKRTDPNSHWQKAVDTQTGQMIGMAKWLIYDGVIPPDTGLGTKEFWDDEQFADYADKMFRDYVSERRKKIKESGGHLCSLDLMIIDPKHQKRGAGKLLVKWGTDIADKMGVEAVTEASDYGRPLYEKYGFKFIKQFTVEPPEIYKHRPRQSTAWMVRPKMEKHTS